jgi:hypothetical protein
MAWIRKNKLTAGLTLLLVAALACMVVFMATLNKTEASKLVVYGRPGEVPGSETVSVSVEDTPLFVYKVPVNNNRIFSQEPVLSEAAMSYFDFEGRVRVDVAAADLQSVVVRPLSLGIEPQIRDGVASFYLEQPAQLTLEFNGDYKQVLHLFANPLETEVPDKNDPSVIYFEPGVYETGIFKVGSGQTVYLAGGAVVYGGIIADGVENVRIMGRGVFDGSIYDRWTQTTVPVDFRNSRNITVEGVGFMNPAGWTVNAYFCENFKADNVKIISARSNGDGFTIQSCKDVNISNSFVRSWDDSLVVKNYDMGNTSNVRFENMIVWTDLAQSCEVGYETYGETMEDISFENITVLHNFHKPVMSVHNSDQAQIRNVVYRNITVEDAQMGDGDGAPYLMEITIASSQWSTSNTRGLVDGVLFENITVLDGKTPGSNFRGYYDGANVTNVSINNLVIKGERITSMEQGGIKAILYVDKVTIDGVAQEVG